MTPSSTQNGASADLAFDTKYATSNGDTVKNATNLLPAGLQLDSAVVPTLCTDGQLNSDACPANTLVGSSATSGTINGSPVTSNGKVYLVAPQAAGEIARLGFVSPTPFGKVYAEAALTGSAASGISIVFTNVPNAQFGFPILITESKYTLSGTVNGAAFTKLPTACTAATSTLTAVSWNDPAPVTATDSFTPTGCAAAGGGSTGGGGNPTGGDHKPTGKHKTKHKATKKHKKAKKHKKRKKH